MSPEWIPVASSAISAVAYAAGELFVRYVDGDVYAYSIVSRPTFDALLAADSKGTFVNTEIKPRYRCRAL